MLITDTTQRLGMNTMTHLFLQTFFCGDWYGKSITDELEWVVKELTYEEPDKKLMMELRIGLCHGGYVQNKTDVMFAYAMQKLVEFYGLPLYKAKKICRRLQSLLPENSNKN